MTVNNDIDDDSATNMNRSLQESARAHLALERQLPESDSYLVVYQLVVPQLAVLRLPR